MLVDIRKFEVFYFFRVRERRITKWVDIGRFIQKRKQRTMKRRYKFIEEREFVNSLFFCI